jgi:hypothetical protein
VTKPKRPKTKKLTVPKLKEIYGKKAPDYARRPKARGQILRQMRDEAEATGLAEKLDVTLDDVVALEDQDDLDRSIAERTAKNKNFPALVADAQKRAEAWQLEQFHALIDRIERAGFKSVPQSEIDAVLAQQRAGVQR